MDNETENCIIEKVSIDVERGCTFWVHLKYSGAGQAFGGILCDGDLLQRFIISLCKAFEVLSWEDLKGKPARAVRNRIKVVKLGHFLDDKWCDVDEMVAAWKDANKEV